MIAEPHQTPSGTISPTDESGPVVTLMVGAGLVMGPSLNLTALTPHDDSRLLSILVLVVTALVLLASPQRRRGVAALLVGAPRASSLAGAAVAIGVLGALLGTQPAASLRWIALLASLLLTMLVVAVELRTLDAALPLLLWIPVASVALHALSLRDVAAINEDLGSLWRRGGPTGGFSHPRFLNQWQTLMVPLLGIVAAGAVLPRGAVWLARALIVLSTWRLVLTEGRGAILALTASVLIVAFAHGRSARAWARVTGLLALAGGVAALATRPLLGLSGLASRDLTTSSGRITIWGRTLEKIADRPLLGTGPGGHADRALNLGTEIDPHQIVLLAGLEWGVVAGGIIVALLVAGGLRLVRPPGLVGLGDETGTILAGAAGSVGGYLLLGQVSAVTVMPMTQLGAVLAAGLAVHLVAPGGPAAARSDTGVSRSTPPRPVVVGTVLAAVVAASTLVVAVGPDPVRTRLEANHRFVELYPDELFRPHFWFQGYVLSDAR